MYLQLPEAISSSPASGGLVTIIIMIVFLGCCYPLFFLFFHLMHIHVKPNPSYILDCLRRFSFFSSLSFSLIEVKSPAHRKVKQRMEIMGIIFFHSTIHPSVHFGHAFYVPSSPLPAAPSYLKSHSEFTFVSLYHYNTFKRSWGKPGYFLFFCSPFNIIALLSLESEANILLSSDPFPLSRESERQRHVKVSLRNTKGETF